MQSDSSNKSRIHSYKGPIFIIGISRSGTKLLRTLLNNHSQIGIEEVETKFIPNFYHNYYNWSSERIKKNFTVIYKNFLRTNFYLELKKTGKFPEKKTWYEKIETWSLSGVLNALIKYLSELEEINIWGDKTPNYLIHIPILKRMFPEAKFIHITRDVRDVALSAFKAWRRSYYYTAQCWNDYIGQCRKDAEKLSGSDYIEIKYEDLTKNPEASLIRLCDFIGIDFEKKMCLLENPTEDIGDTKDEINIIANNTGKWKTQLKLVELKKIEKICAPILLESNYQLFQPFPNKIKRIKPILMYLYYFRELMYIFKKTVKKKNFISAINTIITKYRFRTTRK